MFKFLRHSLLRCVHKRVIFIIIFFAATQLICETATWINRILSILFQVSTGQHMQLTGDLKPVVSVAAQQGMYFNQQQTQNPAGPAANQTDTYCSVSQSQTINFTQQSLRQRAAAAAAAAGGVPQPGAPGPGARGHPQQVPPGQVDQHHAKLLQQQQLMRAQQVSDLFVLALALNLRWAYRVLISPGNLETRF